MKKKTNKLIGVTKNEKVIQLGRAKKLSILFFVIAILQLIPTLMVKAVPQADPTVIFLRNVSNFVLLMYFGFYFHVWGSKSKYLSRKTLSIFKIMTFIGALGCLFKVIFYIVVLIRNNFIAEIVRSYYIGEIIGWTTLTFFITYYFIMLVPCYIDKHSKKDPFVIEKIQTEETKKTKETK